MFDETTATLASRGITLASLGGAYLVLLGNLVAAIGCFIAARARLVISPNQTAKHYGLYVVMVLATLGIATALENEILRDGAVLQYTALPQILLIAMIHLWIYYDQQPWLIALGASANAGAIIAATVAAAFGTQVQIPHWATLAVLTGLLVYLARGAISTRAAFMAASSIYAASKEGVDVRAAPQTPWLGLPQWIALVAASIILALVNALLRGDDIANLPAIKVAGESTLMLAATFVVGAVPASIYWLAHKNWMPELTRFVWLVWMVVGFAFTYGNILTSMHAA
ncbi:MAG TPA: hypothetical protein VIC71_10845 [Gammaproteobacteria bacterium]|jgi:hypothetical protein